MATNAAATIPALLRLSNLREKFEKTWMRIMAGVLNILCLGVQVFGVVIWAFVDNTGDLSDGEIYRVTIHVVSNLRLTSKQKFCFSIRPIY